MKDYIAVLGSGVSINDLSDKERKIIDLCEVKIAINKYAAFYKKAAIKPTHVYYTDDYYISSRNFFEYMISYLNKEKISNLTFIVSKRMSPMLTQDKLEFLIKKVFYFFKDLVIIFSKNRFISRISSIMQIRKYGINSSQLRILKLPPKSVLHEVEILSHNKKGTAWAKTLKEPLYHFKGSLSSVLNYISIYFPNKKVLLVGVDFNTSNYFFEEELNKLNFETKDWTYDLTKKENKHYSIITTQGVKMDDELPFMISELEKRHIELFNINENSYLVKQNFVKHIDLKRFKKI